MKLAFWPDPKGYRDINLGLSRVYQLLERVGNPHQKLPTIIHIAGTNGKGSTLAFLRAIFEEAKYSVHCYTSPHLVSFNERIVLAGKNISDEFLTKCLQSCKDAALQDPQIEVTYFEGITVAAFLAFSQIKADILLLETGMGGRLDATNVIEKSLLSIITPIAFDHTEFLGKTLEKIAGEKAGIIKENCDVIIGRQEPESLETILKQVKKLNCETKIFGIDWNYEIKNEDKAKKINSNFDKNSINNLDKNLSNKWNFIAKNTAEKISLARPSLEGLHQIENASTAVMAALTQKKFSITIEQINSALQKTFWPARLQKITSGKFAKMLPNNFELIVDGSHNLQGSTTILEFLKSKKNKKRFVIFGMLKDKDCEGFLNKIKSEIDELICITIPNETKSREAKEIEIIAKNLKIKSITANNIEDAFKKILEINDSQESLILLCGSLYLAGEFLEQNYNF